MVFAIIAVVAVVALVAVVLIIVRKRRQRSTTKATRAAHSNPAYDDEVINSFNVMSGQAVTVSLDGSVKNVSQTDDGYDVPDAIPGPMERLPSATSTVSSHSHDELYYEPGRAPPRQTRAEPPPPPAEYGAVQTISTDCLYELDKPVSRTTSSASRDTVINPTMSDAPEYDNREHASVSDNAYEQVEPPNGATGDTEDVFDDEYDMPHLREKTDSYLVRPCDGVVLGLDYF